LKLEGSIDEGAMLDMNAQADIQKMGFDKIAAHFLGSETADSQSWWSKIMQRTREHLWLVSVALIFSILIGILWAFSRFDSTRLDKPSCC